MGHSIRREEDGKWTDVFRDWDGDGTRWRYCLSSRDPDTYDLFLQTHSNAPKSPHTALSYHHSQQTKLLNPNQTTRHTSENKTKKPPPKKEPSFVEIANRYEYGAQRDHSMSQ